MNTLSTEGGASLSSLAVLVTRPEGQQDSLVLPLRQLCVQVTHAPVICIDTLPLSSDDEEALLALESIDWLVFTSANGVSVFEEFAAKKNITLQEKNFPKLACIGSKTAATLQSIWRAADFIPEEFRAEEIAKGLGDVQNKTIVLARAQQARKVLPEMLMQQGAEVIDVPLYSIERVDPEKLSVQMDSFLANSSIEDRAIVVTSGEVARATIELLHYFEAGNIINEITFFSIGPITEQVLVEKGIKKIVTAREYTAEGLLHVIKNHYKIS